MTKMKTLTVSGQTYTVCDPEAVKTVDGRQPDSAGRIRVTDNDAVGDLAWSGKAIADRLCPGFSQQDKLVQCAPLAGYPLEVISYLPEGETPYTGVQLTRCGKNLWQFADMGGFFIANKDNEPIKTETGVRVKSKKNTFGYISTIASWLPVSVLDGKTVTVSCNIARSSDSIIPLLRVGYVSANFGKRNAVKDMFATGSVTFTVDSQSDLAAGCTYIGLWFYVNAKDSAVSVGDYVDYTDFQIEIGNAATAWETYQGNAFAAEFSGEVTGGTYNWATGVLTDQGGNMYAYQPREISALAGENLLYSSTGQTQVTGRLDPVEVMEKLTNAIVSLGGNV